MATPGFTLTATLQTIAGGAAGSASDPARLAIVLCGFGLALPSVAGTSTLAQRKYELLFVSGSPVSQLLWGNDSITPAGTWYSISLIDGNGNIVQTGDYLLTGSGGDLSTLVPIVPPYGFPLPSLKYLPCSGAVPGTVYTAPGTVIAVTYNGVFLRPSIDYTLAGGTTITLDFSTQTGDDDDGNGPPIYALCIA